MQKPRVVVGISGATGFQYGVKVLQLLRELGAESHLVMSRAAGLTRQHETDFEETDVTGLADVVYLTDAVGAAIARGSFQTAGMIVAPCSMHTLAAIASGAADVVLKERRRLVLMTREPPLHLGHIRNMERVTEDGAIVFPSVPSLYNGADSLDAIITHSAARALTLLGFDPKGLPRWGESVKTFMDEGVRA